MCYNEFIHKHETARMQLTSYAAPNHRKGSAFEMTSSIIPQFKICTQCGEKFPATTEYFYKSGNGLRPTCKACHKAYRAEHRDKRRAYNARYRAEHADEIRAQSARYYAEHREEVCASNARWRAEHVEERREYIARYRIERADEIRAQQARYNAEHHEETRAYNARYRAENPEVYKAAKHRRNARKRQLPNTLTTQEWQRCLDYFEGKCAYCGKTEDMWTVIAMEHYIAIKDPRPDNPGTVATNVIPACHARKGIPAGSPCCNQSKHNHDPIEWLEQRFGKRKGREIRKRIETYFEWVREREATP